VSGRLGHAHASLHINLLGWSAAGGPVCASHQHAASDDQLLCADQPRHQRSLHPHRQQQRQLGQEVQADAAQQQCRSLLRRLELVPPLHERLGPGCQRCVAHTRGWAAQGPGGEGELSSPAATPRTQSWPGTGPWTRAHGARRACCCCWLSLSLSPAQWQRRGRRRRHTAARHACLCRPGRLRIRAGAPLGVMIHVAAVHAAGAASPAPGAALCPAVVRQLQDTAGGAALVPRVLLPGWLPGGACAQEGQFERDPIRAIWSISCSCCQQCAELINDTKLGYVTPLSQLGAASKVNRTVNHHALPARRSGGGRAPGAWHKRAHGGRRSALHRVGGHDAPLCRQADVACAAPQKAALGTVQGGRLCPGGRKPAAEAGGGGAEAAAGRCGQLRARRRWQRAPAPGPAGAAAAPGRPFAGDTDPAERSGTRAAPRTSNPNPRLLRLVLPLALTELSTPPPWVPTPRP